MKMSTKHATLKIQELQILVRPLLLLICDPKKMHHVKIAGMRKRFRGYDRHRTITFRT
jgi:hypothetical protein